MKPHHLKNFILLVLLINASGYTYGQNDLNRVVAGFPVNYSEDSVGSYTLPDVFTLQNGGKVKDAKTWMEKRRPEIVKLFEEHQFS